MLDSKNKVFFIFLVLQRWYLKFLFLNNDEYATLEKKLSYFRSQNGWDFVYPHKRFLSDS